MNVCGQNKYTSICVYMYVVVLCGQLKSCVYIVIAKLKFQLKHIVHIRYLCNISDVKRGIKYFIPISYFFIQTLYNFKMS